MILATLISFTSISCLLLVEDAIATPVEVSCPKGQFFEAAAGACKSCRSFCREERKTEACRKFCPGSSAVSTTESLRAGLDRNEFRELCPLGSYEDEDMARCRSCDVICKNAEPKGTEKECKHRCPEYEMTRDGNLVFMDDVLLPVTISLFVLVMCCFVGLLSCMVVRRIRAFKNRRMDVTGTATTRPVKKSRLVEIRTPEANGSDRINQWLALLHPEDGGSCYSSKSSIGNPPPSEH